MENENKPIEEVQDQGEKKTPSSRNAGTMLLLGLVVALIVGVGALYFVGVRGVKSQSQTPVVMKIAQVFHLPIAKVNGESVLYTDFIDNVQAMQHFYDTDTESLPRPTDEEMSDYVLSRLIINKLVADSAKEMDVTLSQEKAEEEIKNRYGWSFDTFVNTIVRPTQLEKKLSETYAAAHEPDDETTKAQAQSVLEQIKNGGDFEALAKQYGSDGTKDQGGDLGWFGKGVMIPEFEEVAFALEKGELNSELVKTEFGYHIIRVDDKRMTANEETGVEEEEVKARHILFPVGTTGADLFRDYMNGQLSKSNIQVAEGIHNPFEEFFAQQQALESGDTQEQNQDK